MTECLREMLMFVLLLFVGGVLSLREQDLLLEELEVIERCKDDRHSRCDQEVGLALQMQRRRQR